MRSRIEGMLQNKRFLTTSLGTTSTFGKNENVAELHLLEVTDKCILVIILQLNILIKCKR